MNVFHDLGTNLFKFAEKIHCSIVENQENIMMEQISEIGGEEYRHITIDKNKVIEAFEKQTARKAIAAKKQYLNHTTIYECPNCGKQFTGGKINAYCYHCGQKMDWSEV